jgi:hypothetical protein
MNKLSQLTIKITVLIALFAFVYKITPLPITHNFHLHAQEPELNAAEPALNASDPVLSATEPALNAQEPVKDKSSTLPFEMFSWYPMVQSGKNIEITNEVNHDLFLAAESVEISGIVNGDVYVATQNLKVGGQINGSLITASQNAVIDGVVEGSVKIAAQTVSVNGFIGKSILGVSQVFTLSQDALINGSLTLAAANLDINSDVGGSVLAAASQVNLNSMVDGPVKIACESLIFGSDAIILSNLDYISTQTALGTPNQLSQGSIQQYLPSEEQIKESHKRSKFFNREGKNFDRGEVAKNVVGLTIGFKAINTMMMALIGFVIIKIAPTYLDQAQKSFKKSPLKDLFYGFGVILMLPILAVLLMITVFGIPLGLITLSVWFALFYLSSIPVALVLGNLIFQKIQWSVGQNNTVVQFLAGLLLLFVIGFIPVINLISGVLITFAGAGMWLPKKVKL